MWFFLNTVMWTFCPALPSPHYQQFIYFSFLISGWVISAHESLEILPRIWSAHRLSPTQNSYLCPGCYCPRPWDGSSSPSPPVPSLWVGMGFLLKPPRSSHPSAPSNPLLNLQHPWKELFLWLMSQEHQSSLRWGGERNSHLSCLSFLCSEWNSLFSCALHLSLCCKVKGIKRKCFDWVLLALLCAGFDCCCWFLLVR